LTRGSQTLSQRDWVFGSRPRRRLLEAILIGRQPKQGWSRAALADKAGVGANDGVDEHLAGLLRLGLITLEQPNPQIWRAAQPRTKLAEKLAAVLRELGGAPDQVPARPTHHAGPRAAVIGRLQAAERTILAAADELEEQEMTRLRALLAEALTLLGA
jgi:hypothetical protein